MGAMDGAAPPLRSIHAPRATTSPNCGGANARQETEPATFHDVWSTQRDLPVPMGAVWHLNPSSSCQDTC